MRALASGMVGLLAVLALSRRLNGDRVHDLLAVGGELAFVAMADRIDHRVSDAVRTGHPGVRPNTAVVTTRPVNGQRPLEYIAGNERTESHVQWL